MRLERSASFAGSLNGTRQCFLGERCLKPRTHRAQDFEALHHTLVQAWATYTDAVDAFALAISAEPPGLPAALSQPAWSEAALAHWAVSAREQQIGGSGGSLDPPGPLS